MTTVTLSRLLAAAAIGIAYHWLNIIVLGHYLGANPINGMLLDVFFRGGHLMTYRVIISLHDMIAYLILALPFAAVFRWIPGLRNWTCVALAASVPVIAVYSTFDPHALSLVLREWVFWFGCLLVAFSLPAAFALLNRIPSRAVPPTVALDVA